MGYTRKTEQKIAPQEYICIRQEEHEDKITHGDASAAGWAEGLALPQSRGAEMLWVHHTRLFSQGHIPYFNGSEQPKIKQTKKGGVRRQEIANVSIPTYPPSMNFLN